MNKIHLALRIINEKHLKNSPTEITIFPEDSFVLARYPTQPPTRLHTLWRGPFQYTDPADIARRDYMEFSIESIVRHKGNSRCKKELKFLVK